MSIDRFSQEDCDRYYRRGYAYGKLAGRREERLAITLAFAVLGAILLFAYAIFT